MVVILIMNRPMFTMNRPMFTMNRPISAISQKLQWTRVNHCIGHRIQIFRKVKMIGTIPNLLEIFFSIIRYGTVIKNLKI